MKIGLFGLGRMGSNMARRLMRGGHQCVVFDLNPQSVSQLAKEGAQASTSLEDLIVRLEKPRAVWIMLPAGEPTEQTVTTLAGRIEPGDILVDGGNSYYQDDVRRAGVLAARAIHYLDAGTSGGVWGAERGYCLMIGGDRQAAQSLEPIFKTLAPRARRHPAYARPAAGDCGAGLPLLWPVRVGTLRQDDSQRHRIRADAILRRRV